MTMSLRHLVRLPVSLIPLLYFPLAEATCYVAAYGIVGEQPGWNACPGTASSTGGVETCCLSGSDCGEDSLCHIANADDPDNSWYQAGCTDSNYQDPICRNDCGESSASGKVDVTQQFLSRGLMVFPLQRPMRKPISSTMTQHSYGRAVATVDVMAR